MIGQREGPDKSDMWAALAAPLPADVVQWRQQGKPKNRDGKFFAPFVAYIDAQFVRARLDSVVPGDWDLTVTELPTLTTSPDGEVNDEPIAFKARLQILGVIREDVGTGRDYKTAVTDAFKRAAVRFGVGHELYTDYEIAWVQVDSDSKYARPVEDPGEAYARRQNRTERPAAPSSRPNSANGHAPSTSTSAPSTAPNTETASGPTLDEPSCPQCGGKMWDNRLTKRNAKAPNWKCKSRSCNGVIWPTRRDGSNPADSNSGDMEPYEPPPLSELPF